MKFLTELLDLYEASAPGRAWEGRLKKIDALMSWLYDKDILTKTEKAQKDKIFHAYYRYYNDGDMPKALQLKGFSKYSIKNDIETALEKYLEDFIKEVLTKYLPKIDRTDFRLDKTIKDLEMVISTSSEYDVHGLLNYWIKTVKFDEDGSIKGMVDKLQTQYDSLKTAANKTSPDTENTSMSYRRDKMKEEKTWNKLMEKQWTAVCTTMDDITAFLKNLQDGIKQLKKSRIFQPEA